VDGAQASPRTHSLQLRDRAFKLLYRHLVALTAVVFVVIVYRRFPVNPTTVALTFLLIVLGLASRWGLTIATTCAIVCTVAFNYYFLPPIHTFTIADPENWIALLAFLITAIIASRLSERARREATNATARRKEVERLYSLSQQLLATDNVLDLVKSIPGHVRDAFNLRAAAMFLPSRHEVYSTSPHHSELSEEQLRAVSGRGEVVVDEEKELCFVPLRIGVKAVGSLGIDGAVLSRETLEAMGSLIAIAIERAGAVETLTHAEAARQSENLRSALLDNITHEFRTPLTSMKLAATALLAPESLTEEARKELLTVLDEEIDRLNRLVGEATEMAQLDAQQIQLRWEFHSVREIVELGIGKSRRVLEGREVTVEIPPSLPRVQVDLQRITEVLVQLLENAAKYSPADSPITVAAEPDGSFVKISVADRGPGIEDLEQSLIFEKFYRGRDQRYSVQGTGMGLAIAKAIVEAHHGRIGLVSQTGSGSVFYFTLPTAEAG
jgi:two-component system sensor histidine kinase KdpD